jgi:hypothetical protein
MTQRMLAQRRNLITEQNRAGGRSHAFVSALAGGLRVGAAVASVGALLALWLIGPKQDGRRCTGLTSKALRSSPR